MRNWYYNQKYELYSWIVHQLWRIENYYKKRAVVAWCRTDSFRKIRDEENRS